MYRVAYSQSAVDALTRALRLADPELRLAIERSLRQIDKDLTTEPWRLGESRPDGTRVHFLTPVGIRFLIDRITSRVLVADIWFFRKRG